MKVCSLRLFVLLPALSFVQGSIPFNFISWARAFQSCSLQIVLAQWIDPDAVPFPVLSQPYKLVRITQSFAAKRTYIGHSYSPHINCQASFIYEVSTDVLEFLLAGSLHMLGPANKYIFVYTFDPKLTNEGVQALYNDFNLLIDFTRLYILHVEQEEQRRTGKNPTFVRVQTACPEKFGIVRICSVNIRSFAFLEEFETERNARMKAIPYYPFALVPARRRSFYMSVWTDDANDDVEVKVNKEILRSILRGFSNQSIDYDTNFQTLNPDELKRRARMESGPLKLTGGASTFIPTEEQAFGFITCYEEPDTVSIRVYIDPLTFQVWLCTVLSSTFLAVVLFNIFKVGSTFLDTQANLLFVLIDQYIPLNEGKHGKLMGQAKYHYHCRQTVAILLTLWLLTALTLSNAYRGILTANVAAPVPTIGVDTFEELHANGFELYSPLESIVRQYATSPWMWSRLLEKHAEIMAKNLDGVFAKPAVGLTTFGRHLSILHDKMQSSRKFDRVHFKYLWKDVYKNYLEMLRLPQGFPDTTMEQVVGSCGKTAFVERFHRLSDFVPPPELSAKWLNENGEPKLRVGSESILKEQHGWLFSMDFKGGRLLSTAMRRLMAEAGIHNWLSKRNKYVRHSTLGYLLGIRTKNVSSLRLIANLIQGLFILYASLLVAALLAFAAELSLHICKRCSLSISVKPAASKVYSSEQNPKSSERK